jgi:hypothetical protein
MFTLTTEEFGNLRWQFATSNDQTIAWARWPREPLVHVTKVVP